MDQTATRTDAVVAEQLDLALRFARDAHAGQRRKQNGKPYIEHPQAVVALLADRGFAGAVLVAAYLHDTVEKTAVELAEIEDRFGRGVADIVESLSEDAEIAGYAERKRALRSHALAAGRASTVLYTADRLCNLRDWHALSASEREQAAARLGTTFEQRLQLWDEDLEDLTALDPELPFLEEVGVELVALRAGAA